MVPDTALAGAMPALPRPAIFLKGYRQHPPLIKAPEEISTDTDPRRAVGTWTIPGNLVRA